MTRLNWEKANQLEKLNRYPKTNKIKPKKVNYKIMKSLYDGQCYSCNGKINKGEKIVYYTDTKKARHTYCSKNNKNRPSKLVHDLIGKDKYILAYPEVCFICNKDIPVGKTVFKYKKGYRHNGKCRRERF